MHKRVQRIQFGESVKVIDPYTRVSDKKPAKPFMVDQTQILFERDLIDINDSDTTVWKQLENYSVMRVGRQPVFTSEDEHCVDALMLCVLGMTLNYPELADVIYKVKPTTKMASLKRTSHLEQALDSVKVDNKSKVGYLDRQDTRDEIIKNCRRGSRGSGIGWASRGARDFTPRTRRTW